MPEDEHIDRLREAIEKHNDPETREEYLDLYAEDVTLHGSDAESTAEMETFYDFVWETVPDLQIEAQRMIADGDEVALRYTWQGTHAMTDERVHLESGLTWFRFENGKVVERWIATGTADAIRDILEP